jgi:GxxExxY protein
MKLLADQVRQVAYAIHIYHGHGHLEKVYENALHHRLRKAGIKAEQQKAIRVFDEDGAPLAEYYADLLVEDELIVELKTVRALAPEHEAQIMGYLKASRKQHGLLINFGSYRFQVHKYIWTD